MVGGKWVCCFGFVSNFGGFVVLVVAVVFGVVVAIVVVMVGSMTNCGGCFGFGWWWWWFQFSLCWWLSFRDRVDLGLGVGR